MLAQAALETGWLKTMVRDRYSGRPSNNLFNLKGKGPAGSVRALGSEFRAGAEYVVEHFFRSYSSFEESFADYARLVLENPRYRKAAVRHDPLRYIEELKAAGYAHDPDYVNKICSILDKYIQPTMEQMGSGAVDAPNGAGQRSDDYSRGTLYEPPG